MDTEKKEKAKLTREKNFLSGHYSLGILEFDVYQELLYISSFYINTYVHMFTYVIQYLHTSSSISIFFLVLNWPPFTLTYRYFHLGESKGQQIKHIQNKSHHLTLKTISYLFSSKLNRIINNTTYHNALLSYSLHLVMMLATHHRLYIVPFNTESIIQSYSHSQFHCPP